jgi:uncharacterized protein YjbJ (UPF0337 family)
MLSPLSSKPLNREFEGLVNLLDVYIDSLFSHSYIATGAKKVDETTSGDVKSKATDLKNQAGDAVNDASNQASKKADEASSQAQKKADELK